MSSSGKIVNLVNPTIAQDAATKSYVDTKFTTVPTPTNTNDAANKGYVDTATTNMATTSSVSTAISTALGSSGTQVNRPTVQRDETGGLAVLTFINVANDFPDPDGASKRALLRCDGALVYNPNTNTLSAGTFSGAVSGGNISGSAGYFSGNVGIGISSPAAPLHVTTSSAQTIDGTGRFWDKNGTSSVAPAYNTASNPDVTNVSIRCSGSIWTQGSHMWVTSDQRIKTNIVNLNADKMINVFRNLRPISFDFIDSMKTNNKKHFGFIAQEVNEVLPEGISLNTDVIPNNMMKGGITKPSETDETHHFTLKPTDTNITLQYMLLTTDTPLNFDISNSYSSKDIYKFKIYGGEIWAKEQEIYIHSDYNVTDDKYTYVIGLKKEAYDIVITESTLFVYGQYVYDLHILDTDTIYTVATAALQEVDRQQQADKARIAELENHVSNLETTVSTQQSLINDILERLKKVERA
jgi:hypothetical protein